MMLTCSAFRCSVFDGSTISGTSGAPGADAPPASECIPDSVLYVTVDDEAFAGMPRNFEHPAHLPLDAPGDVGPLGGGKLDLRKVEFSSAKRTDVTGSIEGKVRRMTS